MTDPQPGSPTASAPPTAALDPTPGTGTELPQGAARAVLAVPAVIKLEPTLRNALHRLRTPSNRWRPQTATTAAAEGILIRRRGPVIDIHVDIAVSPAQPAHRTAAAVQHALRGYLTTQKLTPGTITVAVLTLEH